MRHLNYSHLFYFWTVAREGSIAKATQSLHLTPQTISGQLKLLEQAVGEPLFHRVGRGLSMTETGRLVFQYADEIFSLGAELASRVHTGKVIMPDVLTVGIVNSIPKLVASHVLQPVLQSDTPTRLICNEGNLEDLLGELAVHQLDLILSDRPIPTGLSVRAFSHTLGTSPIAFFAKRTNARRYSKDYPQSLDKAPILLPTTENPLRRALDDWFEQMKISPTLVAEFEDSALMKAFGQAGHGIFPSPVAIAAEVEDMYKAKQIGPPLPITETYFAISPERKLKHPSVVKINEYARQQLLSKQ